MKRLMILGASYTQTPLYEAAKRLGVYTASVSIPGDYPGFALSDEQFYTDISDPEAVVEAARAFGADGVATCGLDLGMRSIGAVCEKLGLCGPSREAAEKAGNKYAMKLALEAAGVQTARFYRVSNEAELEAAMDRLPFPVVLKAVDLMGSRGIFRSDTREEATANFHRSIEASGKDYCLIEEFIEGELFGVEAMIQNGAFAFILPNNTEAFKGAVPSPVGHSVPLKDIGGIGAQVLEQTKKAVYALGLDDCPVNCDFIRRGDRVYVVELTGRSGATGLSEMTGLYYGVDYYEMIVRLALGENVLPYFNEPCEKTSVLTHTISSDRSGVLARLINGNEKEDWLRDLSFNIKPGDAVKAYTNGRDRIGQVIITGEDLKQCEKRLDSVLKKIRLEFKGDIPICRTPVHELEYFSAENRIYIKREDALPFSFGGNKVRFAQAFMEDMERKGCGAMIIYGGYHSNLCRILSAACASKGIPCSMISNIDDADPDEDSFNRRLIMNSGVREYRCRKTEIADTVGRAMEDLEKEGYRPYYIYGNIYGEGNATVPMRTYADLYREIVSQEKELGVAFDYIFLASSTNTSQSGLIAGHLEEGDETKIVGISVTRNSARAIDVIRKNLKEYQEKTGVCYRLCSDPEILVEDGYLAGGYGKYGDAILDTIWEVYKNTGIGLDPTYSGKAFWGMREYLREHGIKDKNILFIHTGGTPLFFDALNKDFQGEK